LPTSLNDNSIRPTTIFSCRELLTRGSGSSI